MKYAAQAMHISGGAIVNIASVSGLSGSRNIIAYIASKHAVIGMTKNAALELATHRIRVNAVCPAPTATDMVRRLEQTLAPDNPQAVRQRLQEGIPLQRYGEPHEIAAAVAFLAGPQASFITGTALTVDGGMLAS
jgi:NAD(P)-dependent dehydrogenase (short-subunit alcohol dehydrogenase family)